MMQVFVVSGGVPMKPYGNQAMPPPGPIVAPGAMPPHGDSYPPPIGFNPNAPAPYPMNPCSAN